MRRMRKGWIEGDGEWRRVKNEGWRVRRVRRYGEWRRVEEN